ncbi:MAG: RpiB/LacA/LacB family sugar-phosphate isomerase [Anaerolineae bacterium]|nr:RpiB/LacA/LacB family sugar-phosphate isomerase [Anaerolineae bacterium]MDW8172644.1 RpiB/LacA/LacB family sugar-phosphate isomerase [Anaerolineae bacterium]
MRLAIASDHAGYPLKQHLVGFLRAQGHHVLDLGVHAEQPSTDYPDAAIAVGRALQRQEAERGIVLCGSGVGVCIAANKLHGVYAAICHDTYSAAQGVEHDGMNVLCLGARVVGITLAEHLCAAFIAAQFQADQERFVRRADKVKALEQGLAPSGQRPLG